MRGKVALVPGRADAPGRARTSTRRGSCGTGASDALTSVRVYLYDDNEPGKKAKALELFKREVEAGRAALSTQVLQEFYVNATRKLGRPLSSERAEARVHDLSKLPLVRVDAPLILVAIARSLGLSFWDALIVESALAAGADRLLTEDLQHGQEIDDLRVENPFL